MDLNPGIRMNKTKHYSMFIVSRPKSTCISHNDYCSSHNYVYSEPQNYLPKVIDFNY